MSKLIVKITLNPDDPFDAVIIGRIKDEANKVAVMKHIAYEAIQGRGIPVIREGKRLTEEPIVAAPLSGNEDMMREINQQADRMLDNF
jgi:hypothetical protein